MHRKSVLALPLLLAFSFALTGCRYASNRVADFSDVFQAGVGITAENPTTGMWPPSLGLYVQATEFLNLGAMTFHGYSAEVDGRGLYAGYEDRTRLGLGPWQRVNIAQEYAEGCENYYKKLETLWSDRMNAPRLRFWDRPAKEQHYGRLLTNAEGVPALHRGWHYWENFNLEISICEPFITHFGFNLRLGFDPSEISDFVLGFFTLDFKHDDLTEEEYAEKIGPEGVASKDFKPASD